MNDVTTPQSVAVATGDQSLDEFLGTPPDSIWRRNRKWIVGGILFLILLFAATRFFGSGDGDTYATQEIRRGDLTVTVSATGNLQPTNEVEVGSEQSGLVTDVYVDNNDRVTKGQPIARLDTSRLRDTITQNQAALAAVQAQVAQAQASAVQARANIGRLEEVYRLSGGKVPSKTELDTGRAENLRAIAGVRAAQAQVTQAQATLSSSQTNLAKATIYSPVTGVVLSRQIDPGQTVAASFTAPVLFTIAEDLSAMKLEVKVDEADVGQVREGQRATFNVDAYPGRTFPAQIRRVDVGANASGSTSSGSSSTTSAAASSAVVAYTAELAVQNSNLQLRPGMTATADIITMEKRNVLLVPNAALRFQPSAGGASNSGGVTSVMMPPRRMGGQRRERQVSIGRGSRQTVYVLDADGKPKAVEVTVGDTNGSVTEVVGGLQPGQKVITSKLATSPSSESGSGGQRQSGSQRRSAGPNG